MLVYNRNRKRFCQQQNLFLTILFSYNNIFFLNFFYYVRVKLKKKKEKKKVCCEQTKFYCVVNMFDVTWQKPLACNDDIKIVLILNQHICTEMSINPTRCHKDSLLDVTISF